jgi:hypothetical protein
MAVQACRKIKGSGPMASATNSAIKHTILAAAMAASLLALSGCGKSEAPAAGEAAAPAPAAPVEAVVALQQEAVAPATGVLTSVDPTLALETVTSIADKGPSCNLEMIAGINTSEPKIEVKVGSKIKVSGWMFSFPTHSIPVNRSVRVTSDDGASAWETIVGTRADRPDILPWFNIGDWALNSGFEQEFSLDALPAGVYHLRMTYTENGKVYSCDNGRTITLVP